MRMSLRCMSWRARIPGYVSVRTAGKCGWHWRTKALKPASFPGASAKARRSPFPTNDLCPYWSTMAKSLRSEEHTSELQSLMRISYAVFCLKKKKSQNNTQNPTETNQIIQPILQNKTKYKLQNETTY